MNILVLNSGSSSLKAKLFTINKKNTKEILEFHIDGINLKNCKIIFKNIESSEKIEKKIKINTHTEAVKELFKHIEDKTIDAIGQRVVHGGEKYNKAVKINKKVLKEIEKLSRLAPLHNPINIETIRACETYKSKTPQIAVFDTAFHQSIPEKAFLYAIPYKTYKKEKIRRYGFHGTSHKYIIEEARKITKKRKSKIISCHIGNGSSITANINGKSIDTSMGLTPLEGIPMGTRSGDIDPAIVLELAKKHGIEETNTILNKKSGLLGISEISSDMRKIYAKSLKNNKQALLAIEILSYKIAKYCGSYAAAMNGIDTIIFTGGLGEKAHYVREQACNHLKFLGLKLNKKANKEDKETISTKDSKIKVLIIKTNEEKQIAKESYEVLNFA